MTSVDRTVREVGAGHAEEADVFHIYLTPRQCDRHARELAPFLHPYDEAAEDEPERLHSEIFRGTRAGGLGLLRDLQDLYLMAAGRNITWTLVGQAAQGLRDEDLLKVVQGCETETAIQLKWLRTRLKQAAPQALVVTP
jgi:hypothetical protein